MPVNIRTKVIKGDIKRALKKFKNKYSEFKIREEVVNRRTYTKPTTVRRKEKMDAIRNNQLEVKELKKENGK